MIKKIITLDSEHRYFADGVRYPGVNEILRIAGLATSYFGDAAARKRDIGTFVHAAIALDLKNNLDISSIQEPELGYFNGYKAFKKDFPLSPFLVEQKLFSSAWGFCGSLDFCGMMNDKVTLIDWKTSAAPAKETAYQMGGYMILVEENGFKCPEQIISLHLFPDGTYKPHFHKNKKQLFIAASLVAQQIVADKFGGDYDRAKDSQR